MDQKKIGEFITRLRKEKGLTQEELADKLKVSSKSVSRWETGVNMPDYSILNSICAEFNINVLELLNGEKKKENNKVFEEYMRFKEKANKKRILLIFFISFLIVIISLLGIYFVNSYKKVAVYQLTGENENFSYSNGLLLTSNIKNVLQTGNLDISNNKITKDNITDISFAYKRENNYYLVVSYNDNTLISEDYGYNEIFDDYTLEQILKNLYLIISYQYDDTIKTDIVKINLEKIMNNDKFFNKKGKYIGNKKNPEKIIINTTDNQNDYKQFLIDNGFGKKERKWAFTGQDTILSKMLGKNKQIDFSYVDGSSYYYYEDENVFIKAFYYVRNDQKENSLNNFITFKITEGEKNYSLIYDIRKDRISDNYSALDRYPYLEKLIKEYYENYKKYGKDVK